MSAVRTSTAELAAHLSLRNALLAGVVLALGVVPGLLSYSHVAYVDRLSIANDFRYGMLVFALPLVTTVLVAFRTDSELRFGYIAYARARRPIRRYLVTRLLVTSCIVFVLFFAFALLSFVVAYYLVPMFGTPSLNPDDGNGMTAGQRFASSLTRQPFAGLLETSPWVYGMVYAGWLGLTGAVYGALGLASVILVRQRVIALTLPFLVYMGETVVMQLAGRPQLTLMASAFPQGLSHFSTSEAIAPLLVLASAVTVTWALLLIGSHRISVLS